MLPFKHERSFVLSGLFVLAEQKNRRKEDEMVLALLAPRELHSRVYISWGSFLRIGCVRSARPTITHQRNAAHLSPRIQHQNSVVV